MYCKFLNSLSFKYLRNKSILDKKFKLKVSDETLNLLKDGTAVFMEDENGFKLGSILGDNKKIIENVRFEEIIELNSLDLDLLTNFIKDMQLRTIQKTLNELMKTTEDIKQILLDNIYSDVKSGVDFYNDYLNNQDLNLLYESKSFLTKSINNLIFRIENNLEYLIKINNSNLIEKIFNVNVNVNVVYKYSKELEENIYFANIAICTLENINFILNIKSDYKYIKKLKHIHDLLYEHKINSLMPYSIKREMVLESSKSIINLLDININSIKLMEGNYNGN